MKIAINRCYGGFQLSDKAIEMLMKRKGLECHRYKWDYKDKKYHKVTSFEINEEHFTFDYSIADLGDYGRDRGTQAEQRRAVFYQTAGKIQKAAGNPIAETQSGGSQG